MGKDDFTVESVVVYKRLAGECPMVDGRDTWWHDEMDKVTADCDCEWVESEHPLFMLYTSGSTGKPKGIVHTTAGYMLGAWSTFKYTFDYKPGEVYWCTADIGWITGHSYIVYGPLLGTRHDGDVRGCAHVPRRRPMLGHLREAQGEPVLHRADRGEGAHESGRRLRDPARQVRFKTPFRCSNTQSLTPITNPDHPHPHRSSLRILGSVGEPINPEAWRWYYSVVGEERCPIVDTYWQTETGSFMITPLPGATPLKPGSATLPFFGVQPVVLDDKGNELEGEASGSGHQETVAVGVEVVLRRPREVRVRVLLHVQGVLRRRRRVQARRGRVLLDHRPRRRRHQRLRTPHGNRGGRGECHYFILTSHLDQSPFRTQIPNYHPITDRFTPTRHHQSALVLHPACSEAAVVGMPHEIKGAGIYCYVVLKDGQVPSDDMTKELKAIVRKEIGPIATPDAIQFSEGLPKTRSGKIMRRILRKLAENPAMAMAELGDISTLADPGIVALLKDGAMKLAGK